MDLICEERPSDSPFVERIWRSHSEHAGPFLSMADRHWGMVVTKHKGKTILTVRGPETWATPAYCPADAEFFGIQFKAGTFMPSLPTSEVMNRRDLNLPEATSKSFWLHGSTWQFPNYENADIFVDWLVRDGLLVHDPIVEAVLQGQPVEMSLRTVQRRLVKATGLTHTAASQIERARYATRLLMQGVSFPDTVYQAGYYDQPHLIRSLKHYIGLTPAQIMDTSRPQRLSFLYNTDSLYRGTMPMFIIPQAENKHEERNHIRVDDTSWSHGSTGKLVLPIPD